MAESVEIKEKRRSNESLLVSSSSSEHESTFSKDHLNSSDSLKRNNSPINKTYRTEIVINRGPTKEIMNESFSYCWKCKDLINVNNNSFEIKFNNHSYHNHCFSCVLCQKNLDHSKMSKFKIDDNGEPICSECELSNAKSCYVCRESIVSGGIISFDNSSYHKNCFCCDQCQKSLVDQTNIRIHNSNPCCIECYEKYFASRCFKCSKSISTGKRISSGGKEYHPDCFSCSYCQNPIVDRQFPTHNSLPYCIECYDKHIAPKCFECLKSISVGKSLIFDEKSYHSDCFRCKQCYQLLPEENTIFKHNCKPCCVECYNKYFALKCSKCSKVINGKYSTFEGKCYHSDCFICIKCRRIIDSTDKFFSDKLEFICSKCYQ